MFAIILTFIFGLGIAYFTAQNTHGVDLTLANYPLTDVPLYMIVIASLLIGLFVGWIINLMQSISSGFTIRGKETAIKRAHTDIASLQSRIHALETENARLRGVHDVDVHEREVVDTEERVYRPSIFDRIRHSFG
jgi:uncharacterized integral membrane protein